MNVVCLTKHPVKSRGTRCRGPPRRRRSRIRDSTPTTATRSQTDVHTTGTSLRRAPSRVRVERRTCSRDRGPASSRTTTTPEPPGGARRSEGGRRRHVGQRHEVSPRRRSRDTATARALLFTTPSIELLAAGLPADVMTTLALAVVILRQTADGKAKTFCAKS